MKVPNYTREHYAIAYLPAVGWLNLAGPYPNPSYTVAMGYRAIRRGPYHPDDCPQLKKSIKVVEDWELASYIKEKVAAP